MTQSFVPSKAQPVLRTAFLIAAICLFLPVFSQHKMERLNRGVIAVRQDDGVFISWRLLETDNPGTAFDIYRQTDNGALVKLNKQPLTGPTHFTDKTADLSKKNTWSVRVSGSKEGESHANSFTLPAGSPVQQYISIPLKGIEGYAPNDCSIGDLDGDGDYELVVHMGGRMMDNSFNGTSSTPILQAYELDGTFMWEINLGINIRDGAHYTQFMVYDLDGDGKAEVVMKTGDGTVDGQGTIIGDPLADHRERNGRILSGNEYLTVFNGQTGAAMCTVDYVPARGNLADWGDSNANRSDRYLACVAYLDGRHPSVVMCRGYYTRAVLAAWDWDGKNLSQHWVFDSDKQPRHNGAGQGNHNIRVADVDGDGKDEIIYGAMCVDHDGSILYNTRLGHGDAMHLYAFSPDSDRLLLWDVHEGHPCSELHDAATGEILFSIPAREDVGRGMAADIDPTNRGLEMWSSASGGIRNIKGELTAHQGRVSVNSAVWWDGDLLRELLDGGRVTKFNWHTDACDVLLDINRECRFNNGTKNNPCLSADMLGDWREEVIVRTIQNDELRIYSTDIPTDQRFHCFMQDIPYRLSVATENVAYNQPPEPGFYFGEK